MTTGAQPPFTDEEFAALMDRLCPQGAFAVAVSGGCDSIALLDLADAYARKRVRDFTVLTVDHGLRPDSAGDARFVAGLAQARGWPHAVLTWTGAKPASNLEDRAREARYALMRGWCKAQGVGALLTAHTRDDQAETFLLRLARGSGVDGLSAMAERQSLEGIALVRPLLDVERARLAARLRARGETWIDDPMNADPRFMRVRMRQARAALTDLGLTPARLAGTAKAMRRARTALEEMSAAMFGETVTVAPEGVCTIAFDRLARAPDEIALRVLAQVLMGVGGLRYRPRLERLERLYAALRTGGLSGGRTLAGCRIRSLPAGAVTVWREASAVDPAPLALHPGENALWDRRYIVALADCAIAGAALVRPLGDTPAGTLEASFARPPKACPADVRATLPGLWVNGTLVSVPPLGLDRAGEGYVEGAFAARFALAGAEKSMAAGKNSSLY